MGGPGSGEWPRGVTKLTARSQPFVDIRMLKQNGLLFYGAVIRLSWSGHARESLAEASVRVEENRLVISYKYIDADGNQQSNQDGIAFDYTACHFGGRRTWFKCPECRRRVALVYRARRGFCCRHCCKLTYLSQNESEFDRMLRKAQKIRDRLGGTGSILDPIPPRPKGMHFSTYWRLLEGNRKVERQFSEYVHRGFT